MISYVHAVAILVLNKITVIIFRKDSFPKFCWSFDIHSFFLFIPVENVVP